MQDWTALHLAARQGDKQTVELLLSKGAEVGAQTNQVGLMQTFVSCLLIVLHLSCYFSHSYRQHDPRRILPQSGLRANVAAVLFINSCAKVSLRSTSQSSL